LPQYAVYSHDREGNAVECNHEFAIVLLVDQDYDTMSGSTGNDGISSAQSMRGYSATAAISCMLASFIRQLGYPARAHHIGTYQVVIPPLLLLSGIGEMSRIGIVLNPFLGVRFKVAVVTTDLPLAPDLPVDFGLKEFCRRCQVCAVECPSRSISTGDTEIKNGYENWRFNAETCTKFRLTNPNGLMCGRCIKVCPWNKSSGWTHDSVRWMIQQTPLFDRFFVKMDSIFGYGKQDLRDRWWLE
jgi:reductive dehalogenase